MSFEWLFELLRQNPGFIPAALFVVALGEAVVFTSPLMPATALFLGLAALQKAAGGDFAVIAAAMAVGTFIGDVISFGIGRVYRDRIGSWWPFRKHPDWLPRSITFMRKWGMLGLIGSKFLGPVRWFGPTVCGVLDMAPAQFLIATTIASVLMALLLLAPSFYGVQALM
ncbi:MAG: DedA family protein [Hyphomicrobiaceae bacterium]